jgi:hypothetical protein
MHAEATALAWDTTEIRAYIGSAYRIAVDFIDQRGHGAAVRARVSPETAQLLDKPPFPFAWAPPRAMDELQTALLSVAGREMCVELGLNAGRKLGGSMIAPVLRMATSLFGNTPATVFQNLERFYSMVLRGMTFQYEAAGPKEAIISVRAQGPNVPAALFEVTRGNLLYVFELCGVKGTADEPRNMRIDAGGGEARYHVRWE